MQDHLQKIAAMYQSWSGEEATAIAPLSASGSYRQYYRLSSKTAQAVGAFFDSPEENKAFINLSRQFHKAGLNVPEIYAVADDQLSYLLQDLGDTTLFDIVSAHKQKNGFDEELIQIFRQIIDQLIRFQIIAGRDLDYSACYPSADFDTQAYMWDLNYFKYNFLKLAQIPYNEYHLEEDFRKLVQLLLSVESSYFVYRDFQTRNIMMHEGQLYFIDYQGGRRGPVHYDLVSLLFQARVGMPAAVREQLIDYYIAEAEKVAPRSVKDFRQHFYKFVLIRILQTLGAYGFRGLYEKKQHFIDSIPLAINNVKWLMDNNKIPAQLSELINCLRVIISREDLRAAEAPGLLVSINSFSYKRGIPPDTSGNGGGFVFDCRALPNPGREAKYRQLTGKDKEVSDYLEKSPEVAKFLNLAVDMVDLAIQNYTFRKFSHLQVNFGCTGGQHRSVYCAEKLAKQLQSNTQIRIALRHLEQE
ncbi:MAG TPA: RNase adapter RapZ [Bacteroidales bacterium]|nr:RNase adapter RapZ [Bacteroidales bacterium]